MKVIRSFVDLPSPLRSYLLAWYVTGAIALVWSIVVLLDGRWSSVLWYIAASLVLSAKTVRGSSKTASGSTSVSMASAAAIAAIIGVCPAAGAVVETSTTVVACVFPKRLALYQSLFNISVVSVGTLAAGLAYRALGGPTIAFGHRSPLTEMASAAVPMLVATTVYFGVNTLAVSNAVALASGKSLRSVWQRNFKTTLVAYTSGGACAILILGLSGYVPIAPLLLLSAPIVYATYSREQTDEARIVALEKGKERLQGLYLASIRTLALTVAAKDPYTNGHIHRVTSYSTAIGRRVGLTEDEITDLETGALLHDIGKIGVPEHILTKPGRLDTEEMALMRRHSEIGWAIIEPLDFPDIVKQIVRGHHESCDGSGYPDGLPGHDVPLLVRIVAVCDVFDALTTHRPYRAALSIAEAKRIMCDEMGPHFDRTLVDVLFKILQEKPLDEICRVSAESPALMDILQDLHPGQPIPSPQRNGIDLVTTT